MHSGHLAAVLPLLRERRVEMDRQGERQVTNERWAVGRRERQMGGVRLMDRESAREIDSRTERNDQMESTMDTE